MSGYCLECGNDLCICDELEEESKRQPDGMFICQRKEVEKLQEQNKELANLLMDSFRYSDGLEGFYVNEWRERAKEALAKERDR